MKRTRHTDAMRALSDLYRIEAERIETAPDVGSLPALRAQLAAVQTDREALASDIRNRSRRETRSRGIPRESAWKILTATFAFAGLAGFLTDLWGGPEPTPYSATLAPLELPSPADVRPRDAAPDNALTANTGSEASTSPASAESRSKSHRHAATQPKGRNESKRDRKNRGGRKGGAAESPRQKPRPPKKPSDDGLGFFDDCGLDPMCGFDKKRR